MNITSTDITRNLERVNGLIAQAASRSGRSAADVLLVAVTKTQPANVIQQAYQAGLRHFGENRVEEAVDKIDSDIALPTGATWHMIGHIQSRKTDEVARLFSIVHSVDRLKIARRLSSTAQALGKTIKVFAEVNLSGEEAKSGYDLSRWPGNVQQEQYLLKDLEEMHELPGLELNGLMTIAPFTDEPETVRPIFARMRQLQDHLLASRFDPSSIRHLSMGMSGDFEVAIEEGATIVRIGTALFGERHYPAIP